jgi:deferrochelatase/peroxidase EfeB
MMTQIVHDVLVAVILGIGHQLWDQRHQLRRRKPEKRGRHLI